MGGHLYKSSDTARIPSKYNPLKGGASFIAPSRRYLSVQGMQSSNGRWYETLLLRGQSTIGLGYEPVVVCTRSTMTSKPSHYESSPYSINKRGEPFGKKIPRERVATHSNRHKAQEPRTPSRHTRPSKNGDTHGKKNPPFSPV